MADSDRPLSIALETSGRQGSVALGRGNDVIVEQAFSGQMKHSIELFPTIQALIEQAGGSPADIKRVYLTIGPGSFTGLRIGLTAAKMIALASNAAIVPVSTCQTIARNASRFRTETSMEIPRIATVLDAKRKQFFIAVFTWHNDSWIPQSEERLLTVEQFQSHYLHDPQPIYMLGEGLTYHRQTFEELGAHILPEEYWSGRAGEVFHLGSSLFDKNGPCDAASLVPRYIRRPEAVEKWEKLKAQGLK